MIHGCGTTPDIHTSCCNMDPGQHQIYMPHVATWTQDNTRYTCPMLQHGPRTPDHSSMQDKDSPDHHGLCRKSVSLPHWRYPRTFTDIVTDDNILQTPWDTQERCWLNRTHPSYNHSSSHDGVVGASKVLFYWTKPDKKNFFNLYENFLSIC